MTLAAPDPGAPDAGLMQGQARQAEKQQTGYREPRVGGGAGGIDRYVFLHAIIWLHYQPAYFICTCFGYWSCGR